MEHRTASNVPTSRSEFVYDYASRRVVTRELSFNGVWRQTDFTLRVFDGLDVIQERHQNNYLKAFLVRDGNIAGILSRTTADGPAFYGYDGNGNVTLLTDGAGQDVGRYRYDAFGQALEIAGPRAGENPYRFSTKELHAASGLVDFGFRFYSPGMGRWMNRDPLGEEGGINLYHAFFNDPVSKWDEYGEVVPLVCVVIVVGGAIVLSGCSYEDPAEEARLEKLRKETEARRQLEAKRKERAANKAAGKGGSDRYKGVDSSIEQNESLNRNNRGQRSKDVATTQGKSPQAEKQALRNVARDDRKTNRRTGNPDTRPPGSPDRRVGDGRRASDGSRGRGGKSGGGGVGRGGGGGGDSNGRLITGPLMRKP